MDRRKRLGNWAAASPGRRRRVRPDEARSNSTRRCRPRGAAHRRTAGRDGTSIAQTLVTETARFSRTKRSRENWSTGNSCRVAVPAEAVSPPYWVSASSLPSSCDDRAQAEAGGGAGHHPVASDPRRHGRGCGSCRRAARTCMTQPLRRHLAIGGVGDDDPPLERLPHSPAARRRTGSARRAATPALRRCRNQRNREHRRQLPSLIIIHPPSSAGRAVRCSGGATFTPRRASASRSSTSICGIDAAEVGRRAALERRPEAGSMRSG